MVEAVKLAIARNASVDITLRGPGEFTRRLRIVHDGAEWCFCQRGAVTNKVIGEYKVSASDLLTDRWIEAEPAATPTDGQGGSR